jgi:hypothetical protein
LIAPGWISLRATFFLAISIIRESERCTKGKVTWTGSPMVVPLSASRPSEDSECQRFWPRLGDGIEIEAMRQFRDKKGPQLPICDFVTILLLACFLAKVSS